MKKALILSLLMAFSLSSCQEKLNVREWVVSTINSPWQIMNLSEAPDKTASARQVAFRVDINNVAQQIEGFGVGLSESGWQALSLLSQTERNAVLKELFASEQGANLSVLRIPVGADELSPEYYSYDEVDADFDLRYFSVAHDEQVLIPYIKEVLSLQPSLQVWAASTSAPFWLKLHDGQTPDELTLQTYADYIGKYVDAYKLRGIEIDGICLADSLFATDFPRYLYPEMEKRSVQVDSIVGKETDAENAWEALKSALKSGVKRYDCWNIAIEEGKCYNLNFTHKFMVIVHAIDRNYHFTPEYYLLKHVSRYVAPGAYLLNCKEDCFQDALAFVNPDKSVVVVAANQSEQPIELSLGVYGKEERFVMQPRSFHTWFATH